MSAARGRVPCCLLAVLSALVGCEQKMAKQPRYAPLAPGRFFADGQSGRAPVPGTRAHDETREDVHLLTGKKPGTAPTASKERPAPSLEHAAEYEETFPFAVSAERMRHGRERFGVYCAACHGTLGDGSGVVVRAGYPQAESFHTDRLRRAPAGYLFDVVTHGYKKMPGFARQIAPRDRWAILAYVRALQLSRHAELKALPPELRQQFR
jgi:mono/diheme cytochrome c family protein